MLISKEELRRLSITTWPRVIGASVVCLASMGVVLVLQAVGWNAAMYAALPVMFVTFAYAVLSWIMTENYKKVSDHGPGWDALTDTDDLFRRFIVREEIK